VVGAPASVVESPGVEAGGEPAAGTGVRVGYLRVPAPGEALELGRRLDALAAAGCSRVFAEVATGKGDERPKLAAALEFLRPGDVLVVPGLECFARSLPDLVGLITDLDRRGVGFVSLREGLDTTAPGGGLVFDVFAALAGFVCELVAADAQERGVARERGPVRGRPAGSVLLATPELIMASRALLPDPAHSVTSIARLLGVSKATLYHHIRDLRELRPTQPRPSRPPGRARGPVELMVRHQLPASRCS
jgi:DNA invertase Pin-like site-specific DNA recombinase